MTAETLKPYISLPGNPNLKPSRSTCLIRTLIALALTMVLSSLLGYTIWNSIRITQLESETNSLKNIISNMQKRLGLDYIEDLEKFEEAYSKNLPDDSDTNEGVFLDSYEDEDDEKQNENSLHNEKGEDGMDEGEGSGDYDDEDLYDDLYEDLEKFRKSKIRTTRSVLEPPYGIPIYHESNSVERSNVGSADEETEKLLLKNIKTPRTEHILDGNKKLTNSELKYLEDKKIFLEFHGQLKNSRKLTGDYQKLFPIKKKHLLDLLKSHSSFSSDYFESTTSHTPLMSTATATSTDYKGRQKVSRFHSIAIQLVLNESRSIFEHPYRYENAPLYDGNFYIGAIQPLIQQSSLDKTFDIIENGIIKIKIGGLYYIYAQISYNNSINRNGFNIFHNDKPLLQCTITTPLGYDDTPKRNTCYTGGITYLNKDDEIYVRDLYKNRSISSKESNSFFGLIRLA